MNNCIPEISTMRCDFSLIGSAKYIFQIEEAIQWKSNGQTNDWSISTGDVTCNDTSLVTNIILNLLPEYKLDLLSWFKEEYRVEPVLDLKIHCKESCFPFITLDRKAIRFLKNTQTVLRLFIYEDGSASNCQEMRLKLVLKGENLPFEAVEKMAGEKNTFRRHKYEFPAAVQDKVEDFWLYETKKFYRDDIQKIADSLCSAFSGKMNFCFNSKTSLIEISIYRNNENEGISLETTIPQTLISLADELGVSLFIGSYLVTE